MILRKAGVGLILGALAIACGAAGVDEDGEEGGSALSARNLGRQDFGLQDKELILTLDDGPGARTKEVVDFLVREQVPAVFFMVGKNAQANPGAMNYVAEKSSQVPGGLIVANHSQTHSTPLPSQGVGGASNEIMTADRILAGAIRTSQSQFGSATSFFRPPYGAFAEMGAANVQAVNASGAEKYVGPIFWDIGGELKNGYAADWACWGQGVSVDSCRNGYVTEIEARKKGIILVHDVHSKTIDMLTGTGSANGVSLISVLRAPPYNYKFVGMRAHDPSVSTFAQQQQQQQQQQAPVAVGEIRASTAPFAPDGNVEITFDLTATRATKGVIVFDGDQRVNIGATGTIKRKLGPGGHRITIAALGADGSVVKVKELTLIVPADVVDPGSSSSTAGAGSACTNYANLTPGRPFKLFIKKVACSTPGAAVGFDGECYQFNGTLRVGETANGKAAIKAIGGAEWTVEYNLSFEKFVDAQGATRAGDPNDNSKVSMILETGSGKIVTGMRHAFTNARGGAVDRSDVPLEETEVNCEAGIWRGKFTYANGATEDFLFRRPSSNEAEYNER